MSDIDVCVSVCVCQIGNRLASLSLESIQSVTYTTHVTSTIRVSPYHRSSLSRSIVRCQFHCLILWFYQVHSQEGGMISLQTDSYSLAQVDKLPLISLCKYYWFDGQTERRTHVLTYKCRFKDTVQFLICILCLRFVRLKILRVKVVRLQPMLANLCTENITNYVS